MGFKCLSSLKVSNDDITTYVPNVTAESTPRTPTSNNHFLIKSDQVLLSTALINVSDNQGKVHVCRALLDSGAESNFISADFAKKLNLTFFPINNALVGVNQSKSSAHHLVKANISSRFNAFKTPLIVPCCKRLQIIFHL